MAQYVTRVKTEKGDLQIDYNALANVPNSSNPMSIENGGIGANNGKDGLKKLLQSGAMILSSYQYGENLPASGEAGQIFFKLV